MKTYTLLLAGLLLVSCKKETGEKIDAVKDSIVEKTVEALPVDDSICFLKVVSKDSISLKARKNKDSIFGTFRFNPYEKDKKTIHFKGRIFNNNVTAIGQTMAEGMEYKEELIFSLTDSTATVKFGEMIENDNGVWMYKNKSLTSNEVLKKTDCN